MSQSIAPLTGARAVSFIVHGNKLSLIRHTHQLMVYKDKITQRVTHGARMKCTCSAEGPDCFPPLLLLPVPLLLFAAMLKWSAVAVRTSTSPSGGCPERTPLQKKQKQNKINRSRRLFVVTTTIFKYSLCNNNNNNNIYFPIGISFMPKKTPSNN